jgi:hypothetical protein
MTKYIYHKADGAIDTICVHRIQAKDDDKDLTCVPGDDSAMVPGESLNYYHVVEGQIVRKNDAEIQTIESARIENAEKVQGERIKTLLEKAGYDIRKVEP